MSELNPTDTNTQNPTTPVVDPNAPVQPVVDGGVNPNPATPVVEQPVSTPTEPVVPQPTETPVAPVDAPQQPAEGGVQTPPAGTQQGV